VIHKARGLCYLLLAALLACDGSGATPAQSQSSSPAAAQRMRLETVSGRFDSPVHLASPPGDRRLFVVEQAGRIRIVSNGTMLRTPFLDISSRVKSGGEQGLLSVAFHPQYRANGYFFVNFTDLKGDTHVERFRVSSNPDLADLGSARLVLKIDQPYSNHNGGLIMFGPDGMLYIGMGDGGSGGDPHRHGQDPRSLLGKMLRIDVSGPEPYAIPKRNPFANGTGGRPEIWATGMRNPWRFSFDRTSGMLFIADVGQSKFEEINAVPSSRAGVNYGWNIMEGTDCYGIGGCSRTRLQLPVHEYRHSGGACSVTGGFVYRGAKVPAIAGHYFYSDYCAGWLRSFRLANGSASDHRQWKIDGVSNITSFGEDGVGELYIVSQNGRVYRMAGLGDG